MSNKHTGGPAFPFDCLNFDHKAARSIDWQSEGMTLRDYFAAKAMAALISSGVRDQSMMPRAYEYADAMLIERSK